MLAVTNPTRSGQKPKNTTLNGDFFFRFQFDLLSKSTLHAISD